MGLEAKYDAFISYRWVSPDREWVRNHFFPALQKAGLKVLLDVEDFVPGRDLMLEMSRAGRESRKVICVLSPAYFQDNRMVSFEALSARRGDPAGMESRLIPFLFRQTDLPDWISGLIPVDWTQEESRPRAWRNLLQVLKAKDPSGAPPSDEKFSSRPARSAAQPEATVDTVALIDDAESVPLLAPEATRLIEDYLSKRGTETIRISASEVVSEARRLSLFRVDEFTLELVHGSLTGASRPADLAEIINARVTAVLGQDPEMLDAAAQQAFRTLTDRALPNDASGVGVLLRQHALIRDYLVARHVVSQYALIGEAKRYSERRKPAVVLDRLFQCDVNRFIKAIILGRERRRPGFVLTVANAIEQILNPKFKAPTKIRAHACYVAGRLTQDQVVKKLRVVLQEKLNAWEEKLRDTRAGRDQPQYDHEDAEELLVARGLYISLGFLKSFESLSKYVEILLSSAHMDALNRGFHLEYYKDQAFIPDTPLVSLDNLGPCWNTLAVLISHLDQPEHPLRMLEAQTLASLAQHRLERGLLEPEIRERIAAALDRALKVGIQTGQSARNLPDYISMVLKHLGKSGFSASSVVYDFWKLKQIPRQGWVDRKAKRIESVAAHTTGALILGLLFLPESYDADARYSKRSILRFILIHDLAEARTGDIPDGRKGADHDKIELDHMKELSFLGTYSDLGSEENGIASPSLRYIAADFEEFQADNTINAQIAHDLDKLDRLLEGLSLVANGEQGGDVESYYDIIYSSKEVSTDMGRHILRKILEMDRRFPPLVESAQAWRVSNR